MADITAAGGGGWLRVVPSAQTPDVLLTAVDSQWLDPNRDGLPQELLATM